MSQIHDLSVAQLNKALHTKELGAVEVATHFLNRIEQDKLGSFLSHNPEFTLRKASESQEPVSYTHLTLPTIYSV